MAALGVNIEQEQSPIAPQRKGSFGNELLRMAVRELERSFDEQVQKIWVLLENSMVPDGVSCRDDKQGGTGSRPAARKLVLREKKYHRAAQHENLNDRICPTCGCMTGRGRSASQNSNLSYSDRDVEDSRSENAQKVSDQSGNQKPINNSPSIRGVIEEKRLDKPTHRRGTVMQKSYLPRTKRGFGSLSRRKRQKCTNRKTLAKHQLDNKSLLRGKTVEEVGPILRAITGQQQWSDALVGEASYSGDESISLIQQAERYPLNPMTTASNSGSEELYWGSQYPGELWANSFSSSSSLREYNLDFDFLSIKSSKPPQPREKMRGRLEYRSDIGLRKPDGNAFGARNRLEKCRVQSVPKPEGPRRIRRINLSYGPLRKHKRIRKETLSLPESILYSNYKKGMLASAPTESAISTLPEIAGDVIKTVI